HDPAAYTQGLQYVDGLFYEGTGLKGQSSLRRVDIETGAVLQRHDLAPDLFGEGITVIGDQIYQLTWQNNVAFLYDRATFNELQQWSYPTEGWGLTFDGTNLIMSDGSHRLFFRDPATFAETGQVEVLYLGNALNRINELEYINIPGIGPEVWANIYQTDFIVRIDPATGAVRSVIDLSGILEGVPLGGAVDVLNGIAYDAAGDRLFVTGKLWPALFQIRLVQAGWAQAGGQ
ncbi:MAG: glutaminyl-peptide cyclotransferase, partial [Caldilineaceae bacterium]